MALKVSDVARLAGVSIRTLHHYDEIGLVRPSGRSPAGYRLYAQGDLERLQQVLFFRELDFPLDEIKRIVADRNFDVGAALKMQRRLLTERATRIKALITAVDAAIDSNQKGTAMSNEERFEIFGDFDPSKYEEEAKERWGSSAAYRESASRANGYTREDWVKIKREADAIIEELAKLLGAGRPASSPEAMDLAERHRKHIGKWFYPCPHSMHRALGEMYVSDPRFSETFERHAQGLARYARDAWRANAERQRK